MNIDRRILALALMALAVVLFALMLVNHWRAMQVVERAWCADQPGVSLEIQGPPTPEVQRRCLR